MATDVAYSDGNGIVAVATTNNTSENSSRVDVNSSTVASASQSAASTVTASSSGKTCK